MSWDLQTIAMERSRLRDAQNYKKWDCETMPVKLTKNFERPRIFEGPFATSSSAKTSFCWSAEYIQQSGKKCVASLR